MLQGLRKESVHFLILVILALISACKPDISSQADEEAAYLADYESSGNKWGYIDTSGTLRIEPKFDAVSPFSEGLATVQVKGKWGYIDDKGKIIIPLQYKSAWSFHEGKARVEAFDQPEMFIDRNGKNAFTGEWSAADDFADGMAKVKMGTLLGFIDSNGQLVIQSIYKRAWNSIGGLIVIDYEDHLGVINHKGDQILPPKYDQVKIIDPSNLIIAHVNNSAYVFDAHGKEMAHLENSKMVDSDGNNISVRQSGQMFFFDLKENKIRSDASFTNIIYLEEGIWAGKKDAGYQLLDRNGKEISEHVYTQINHFHGGFAAYSRNEYWGYVDHNGKELTGDIFGLAWDFREGFARAAFQEGIAFIDRKLKLAFYPPPGTMDLRDYSEGLAAVQITK